jgi:hypothetical protein
MKTTNPIFLGWIMFFVCLVNVQTSSAQHVLDFGGQQKVIKVVAERGNVLYYRNWPDTVDGSVRAVLMSDVTALKPLRYGEVDSVFARLSTQAEQQKQRMVQEEMIKKQNRKVLAVEIDLNTCVASNRVDLGGGIGFGKKDTGGTAAMVRVGLDYTNQGQGFIYTTQIPIGVQVSYDMLSRNLFTGIPFLQAMVGYNYVLSGRFDTSRDRASTYLDYREDLLKSNLFLAAGIGVASDRMRFGVSYKLQHSNVAYPEIGYMHFLMAKIAMRL